jgi:hypothetical protein
MMHFLQIVVRVVDYFLRGGMRDTVPASDEELIKALQIEASLPLSKGSGVHKNKAKASKTSKTTVKPTQRNDFTFSVCSGFSAVIFLRNGAKAEDYEPTPNQNSTTANDSKDDSPLDTGTA